jgi:hypothetical protein
MPASWYIGNLYADAKNIHVQKLRLCILARPSRESLVGCGHEVYTESRVREGTFVLSSQAWYLSIECLTSFATV